MTKQEHVMDLATSLIRSGDAELTMNGPSLLGQDVAVVPRSLFTRVIELMAANPMLAPMIQTTAYNTMKQCVQDFCDELTEQYDPTPAELLETLLTLTRMNGYGKIDIKAYDEEAQTAIFHVRDLPSTDADIDVDEFTGDQYWAGMLAGGMTHVFGTDVEAVETQCVLDGNDCCRFYVGPEDTLQDEHPDLHADYFATNNTHLLFAAGKRGLRNKFTDLL